MPPDPLDGLLTQAFATLAAVTPQAGKHSYTYEGGSIAYIPTLSSARSSGCEHFEFVSG